MNTAGKASICFLNVAIAYLLIILVDNYKLIYLNLNSSLSPLYIVFIESTIIAQIS